MTPHTHHASGRDRRLKSYGVRTRLILAAERVVQWINTDNSHRLAALLCAVLVLQNFLLFGKGVSPPKLETVLEASAGLQAEEGKQPSKATLQLWDDFQAKGGQLADASVPLTTRRVELKTNADVEGANMEHNMSITNPCLTTSDLLRRAYLQPTPKPFSPFGQHRFIMRSGYRTSPRDFSAVGLMLRLPESQLLTNLQCFWLGAGGRKIEGEVKSIYPGEHHNLMYETVIHRCTLDEPTTGKGGGSAVLLLDGGWLQIYSEQPGDMDIYADPAFFFGFCSFPMYRALDPAAIKDWLQWSNYYLEVDYFVLSDAGSVDDTLYQVLDPYVRAGVMEIVDVRGEFRYETKHNVLTLNDCLHRMSYKAQWVLFMDFDEYLYVKAPLTLPQLLRRNSTAPYFSFGSLWWSLFLCRNPGASNLERMLFHWPHFYCVGEAKYPPERCLNYFGHRKFIANPKKTDAVQVHRPIEPMAGGVEVETTVAYFNHFQGISRADRVICNDTVEPGKQPEWWVEEPTLSDIWKRVKYKTQPRKPRRWQA